MFELVEDLVPLQQLLHGGLLLGVEQAVRGLGVQGEEAALARAVPRVPGPQQLVFEPVQRCALTRVRRGLHLRNTRRRRRRRCCRPAANASYTSGCTFYFLDGNSQFNDTVTVFCWQGIGSTLNLQVI